MPEILPNPFTDPAKLPKRSLFDVEKDEQQEFIDQAMAKGLEAAQESMKKKFTDPELQKIWDNIEEKIESGEIKLREITIGGKTKEQLIEEIESAGMEITDDAKKMMADPAFQTVPEVKDLELINLDISDLGLPTGATTKQIYDRAIKLGYELAPAEVGPQFRLQSPDQPAGEYLMIAMKPMMNSSGKPVLFDVSHSTGRILDYNFADLGWITGYGFLFVRG